MIDGMFQAGTDSALDDQVQRPAPFKPDEPGFSFSQIAKAPFQGVASGSTKSLAFAAEMTGAFGDVMGAGGFNAGGMFAAPTPEERKQQNEASRRLQELGPQYSNPAGDLFRQRAKEMMPDPTQTHAAAQVIAGVSEFATQAVGYAALGGPAGPALLAGDAALAESDKLKQEGVPLGARSAAGAVAGAVAGVSVALPVVGKTVASTAALVVAGGPGGFIAQNVAERAILQNAGYDKLASQYDPLDPVGLALSTVVPAAFGGVALRARAKAPVSLKEVVLGIESNGQRFGKDGKVLTSPKGAKGEMQVMDGTNLDPGFGVRPAADDSLAERARVGSDYLDAMVKRYGSEDKAMAAYNAGPGALDKALAKGGDWLKNMPAETQAYVAKGMKKLEGGRTTEAARAVIARDPEAVAAARVSQTAQAVDSFRLTPDSDLAGMTRHTDAIESAHEMLARGERVEVSDLVRFDPPRPLVVGEPAQVALRTGEVITLERRPAVEGVTRQDAPAEIVARNQAGEEVGTLNFSAAREPDVNVPPQFQRRGVATALMDAAENSGDVVRAAAPARTPEGQAFRESRAARQVDRPAALAAGLRKAFEPLPEPRAPRAAPAAEPRAGAADAPAKPKPPPKEGAGTPEAKQSAALESQSAEIAAIDPDMMVQLEGREPMKVSELLEKIKEEAKEDAQEASLVDVAANCFVRT